MVQGGNQWSGWSSYLSAFRHVLGLDLDYSKWDHYEKASIHGGRRWMHEEFCMVSDRPEVLTVDAENRPHNDTGPFCRWRDGTALYSVHGVRVPAWLIERPSLLTAAKIDAEKNAEVRRVMVDRFGQERYLRESNATLVAQDKYGKLWCKEQPGDEDICMVEVINSTAEPDGTFKTYFLGVPPSVRTPTEAVAWCAHESPTQYNPEVET